MEEKDRIRLKGLVTLPGIAIGSVIAAVYLALTLLIPSQVRMIQNGLTNARMYPYFVCICSMLLLSGLCWFFVRIGLVLILGFGQWCLLALYYTLV